MQNVLRSLVLVAVLLSAAGSAHAQTTQTLTFAIDAINQMSITGTAPSLTVNAATAGSAPTAASSSGLTWAITTNEANRKVTASINQAMPAGVTLTVSLGAPSGASSPGAVTLGTGEVDAVTGITRLNQGSLSLNYELSATSAAGTVTSATRTVTYTIMAGS